MSDKYTKTVSVELDYYDLDLLESILESFLHDGDFMEPEDQEREKRAEGLFELVKLKQKTYFIPKSQS